MGCSDSKSADKDDKKPKDKQDQQQNNQDEDRDWVTKDEAMNYVVKEMDIDQEMAEQFVGTFDQNEDGKIKNQELVELWNNIQTTKNEIEPLFKEIDQDDKGYVTCDEAAQVLKKKFTSFDDEHLQHIAKGFDEDDNDQCRYGEFIFLYCNMKARRQYMLEKFESLDKDESSQLQWPEVRKFLMNHCMIKKEKQVESVFFKYAGDDKVMNREEFKTMYNDMFPDN